MDDTQRDYIKVKRSIIDYNRWWIKGGGLITQTWNQLTVYNTRSILTAAH